MPSKIFGDRLELVDRLALRLGERADRILEAIVEMILDQRVMLVISGTARDVVAIFIQP